MALWKHTSGAELSANPSLKPWAGGMMGHGPAFVILMKRQANCLSSPSPQILHPSAASPRAIIITTTFPWFFNYYIYVPSFLNLRLHPWLHPFQHESSTTCVCAQVCLCGWGSSSQQMELECGWDGSTPLADIRDLIRGSACLQASPPCQQIHTCSLTAGT